MSRIGIGDDIIFKYQDRIFKGKICQHRKTIVSELVDNSIFSYETNKYHVMIDDGTNSIITFDTENSNINILEIRKKERNLF